MTTLKTRVVVTGYGLLTPHGRCRDKVWQHVVAGKSAIQTLAHAADLNIPSTIGGLVKDYNPDDFFSSKDQRKHDPFIQYALLASDDAVTHAGLEINAENPWRVGVAVGTGVGGLTYIEQNHCIALEQGARKIAPSFVTSSTVNLAAGAVAIRHGCQGPNVAVMSACASSTHNIGFAARMIAYGDADVMLAGGSEKASTLLGMGGFAAMKALSTRNDDPQAASRPWDKDRDGFVLSDGAAILVLESYEHAKARGADILAEMIGFGMSADAHHLAQPDISGFSAAQAMTNALHDAQCEASDIDYINAHATSTPAGDPMEVAAIKQVFKDHAYIMPVSSTKSVLGHMLGATGAVEAALCVRALQEQVAPPTINCDVPDEGLDLNFVRHEAQAHQLDTVLSNSFGFGGTNACIILRRV